jgi:hypothetical protein
VRETPTRPLVSPLGLTWQGNAESPGSDGASPYLLPAGLSRAQLLANADTPHADPPTRFPPPPADTFLPKGQGLSGRDDPMGEEAKHPSEICVRIL